MKILLLFCGILLTYTNLSAQAKSASPDIFYLFDAQDNPVKTLGEAKTIEVVSQQDDTTFVIRFYKNYGPMIWQQTFKDAAFAIPHGRFAWYDKKGNIDSTGIMWNGKKEGKWEYFDSLSKREMTDSHPTKGEKGKFLLQYLANIPETCKYYRRGKEITDSGKENDENSNADKQLQKDWNSYLEKNIDPATGTANDRYTLDNEHEAPAVFRFSIGTNGHIADAYMLHSSGIPYDKEIRRLLQNAPPLVNTKGPAGKTSP